jgi:transposase
MPENVSTEPMGPDVESKKEQKHVTAKGKSARTLTKVERRRMIREARALRRKGLTNTQIGKKLGVHETTAASWTQPLGLLGSKPRGHQKINDAKFQAFRLIINDRTIPEIEKTNVKLAGKFEIAESTVEKWKRELARLSRPRRGRPPGRKSSLIHGKPMKRAPSVVRGKRILPLVSAKAVPLLPSKPEPPKAGNGVVAIFKDFNKKITKVAYRGEEFYFPMTENPLEDYLEIIQFTRALRVSS